MKPSQGGGAVAELLLKAVQQLEPEEREALLKHLLQFLLELREDRMHQASVRALQREIVVGSHGPIGGTRRDFEVIELLGKGLTSGEVAERFAEEENSVRQHARVVYRIANREGMLSDAEERILCGFALGQSRAAIAQDLRLAEDIVEEHVVRVLERMRSGAWWRSRRAVPPNALIQAGSGPATQQVPVRLSEEQHRQLKEWCARNNFSMAVVMRGLIGRFLEEQERRAS